MFAAISRHNVIVEDSDYAMVAKSQNKKNMEITSFETGQLKYNIFYAIYLSS